MKKQLEKFSILLTIIFKSVVSIFNEQRSRHHIKKLLKNLDKIYLEIGSGDKKGKNGWITLDIAKNCDVFWDLRKGIPFPDNSIAKIYSSHFLEHLTFKEGEKFLQECRRVLSPGGVFSICVPNAKIYIDAYLNPASINEKGITWYKPALNHTTKIDYVNYMAYMDGHHKYMFDEENLIHRLENNGFSNVRLRGFDPNLDLKERDFESIYARAET